MIIRINGQATKYKQGFEFRENLKFDEDLRMFYREIEETITLRGEAYQLFKTDLDNNNLCAVYDIEVECNGRMIFSGKARLIDSGLIPNGCEVDTKFVYEDDYTTISELSGDKVFADSTFAKNDNCCWFPSIDQTPLFNVPRTPLLPFGCNGETRAYKFKDLVKHHLDYQGLNYPLGYIDPFVEDIFLQDAGVLAGDIGRFEYSLKEIIDIVNKKIPIVIDLEGGVINIYSYDDYYEDTAQAINGDFKLQAIRVNKDEFYSQISLGNGQTTAYDEPSNRCTGGPEDLTVQGNPESLNGWGEFTINLNGCGNGDEFNLSSGAISDYNSVENIIKNNADRSGIVVMYNKTTPLNFELNNRNTLERYRKYLADRGICLDEYLAVGSSEMQKLRELLRQNSNTGNRFSLIGNTSYDDSTAFPIDTNTTSQDINGSSAFYDHLARLHFTPTETDCYCIRAKVVFEQVGTADIYNPNNNGVWNIFDDTQDIENDIPIHGLSFDLNNYRFGSETSWTAEFSQCVNLTAGVTYIIDDFTFLNPSVNPINDGKYINRGSSIDIFKCEPDNSNCVPKLLKEVEGFICHSDWEGINKRKKISIESCGETYEGHIIEAERDIKSGKINLLLR